MKSEEINLTVNVDFSPVAAAIIAKTIRFYNVKTTEEEVIKLSDEILKDEKVISALKNLIK